MNNVRGDSNHYNTLSVLFGFVIKVIIVIVIFVHWDYIQFWIYLRYVQVLRLVEDIVNHFSSNELARLQKDEAELDTAGWRVCCCQSWVL